MSKRSANEQERGEDGHQAWSASGVSRRVRDEAFSGSVGDMSERNGDERQRQGGRSRKQRGEVLQAFLIHFGVYAAVIIFLFLLNLMTTGPGELWFVYPALAWGVAVAIHGVVTAVALNASKVEEWAEQPMLRRPKPQREPAQESAGSGEMERLMAVGAAKIDGIRDTARRIPDAGARQEALDVSASADRVLSALAEFPDELPLARKFLHNIVEPAEKIVSTYQRLSSRDIASARESLAEVERHDLPLVRQKMDDIYERLHRGTLIDLDVAREMLVLDLPAASVPTLATNKDPDSDS